MDLNLYLGLPRSSRPRGLDLGSDLSLSSLPRPSSSNSGESRPPDATEASASHDPYSPPYHFIGEADVPSVNPCSPDLENPMLPCFHAYEPCEPSCYREDEGSSAWFPRWLHIGQMPMDPAEINEQHNSSFDAILGLHLVTDNPLPREGFRLPCLHTYRPPPADFQDETLPQSPDVRFRRLIESQGRRQNSPGQSLLHGVDSRNYALNSSSSPEQFMLESTSLQPNGKQKATAESIDAESSENGDDEMNRWSTNFECNICFDVSREPVVTSCGHLFCWPCLYQWLHLHSEHKECPVCKGEVIETNITPIYGRGSSESDTESRDEESNALGLSIPPRPHGHRLESWRQHLYPISLSIGEGITNSRSTLLNDLLSRGRFVEHDDAFGQEIFNRGTSPLLTRSVIRRFQGITESGPSTEGSRFLRQGVLLPRGGGAVPLQAETDTGNEIHSLISMNFGIGWAGRSFSENTNWQPSPSANAPTRDQYYSIPVNGGHYVVDQAPASSTVAMINGESSVREPSTEPNSVGSSGPPRMIRGSSAASSSDGGNLCSRKRRFH